MALSVDGIDFIFSFLAFVMRTYSYFSYTYAAVGLQNWKTLAFASLAFGLLGVLALRWWQIAAGSLTILIMFVGLSGNVLTIIAFAKYPRIRNVASTFIISLCVADGIFCAVVLPFNAIRFFGLPIFAPDTLLCKLIPFLQYANVGLSLLFIAMITINRYVMIAHSSAYKRIYKPTNVAGMIIFCLVLSFGMQIPTLLEIWGKYDYNETLNGCSVSEDEHGNTAKTCLFIVAFAIPCVVIIYCYARIFSVVHDSELRMRRHYEKANPSLGANAPALKESKRKRNEWRITKMVLAIFLSFVVCYLPITVVKIADRNVDDIHLHLISYITLYTSACTNPIIYVIMNKQYRKAYGSVIFCKPASIFNISSAKTKEEPPSKTLVSQVSVSMIPMNAVDHQKVNYGS